MIWVFGLFVVAGSVGLVSGDESRSRLKFRAARPSSPIPECTSDVSGQTCLAYTEQPELNTTEVKTNAFTKCTFTDISAGSSNSGGALHLNAEGSTLSVDACKFTRCKAPQNSAGAICCSDSVELSVSKSSFFECSAASAAGALYVSGLTSVYLDHTLFSHCSLTSTGSVTGGAIKVQSFHAPITTDDRDNSKQPMFNELTVDACEAPRGEGGGLYLNGLPYAFTMRNSQITRCTASKGGGIWLQPSSWMNNRIKLFLYCFFATNKGTQTNAGHDCCISESYSYFDRSLDIGPFDIVTCASTTTSGRVAIDYYSFTLVDGWLPYGPQYYLAEGKKNEHECTDERNTDCRTLEYLDSHHKPKIAPVYVYAGTYKDDSTALKVGSRLFMIEGEETKDGEGKNVYPTFSTENYTKGADDAAFFEVTTGLLKMSKMNVEVKAKTGTTFAAGLFSLGYLGSLELETVSVSGEGMECSEALFKLTGGTTTLNDVHVNKFTLTNYPLIALSFPDAKLSVSSPSGGSEFSCTFTDIKRNTGNGAVLSLAITEAPASSWDALSLSYLQFTRCSASAGSGGAIYITSSVSTSATLTHSSFVECSAGGASGSGGAITTTTTESGTLSLTLGDSFSADSKCTFTDCSAGASGGAVYVSGSVSLYSTEFSSCTAQTSGGAVAIHCAAAATARLSSCTFTKCTAAGTSGNGGAVSGTAADGVTLNLVLDRSYDSAPDCTFSCCTATGNGGGVYLASPGSNTQFSRCTFDSCSAGNGGAVWYGGATLPSSTLFSYVAFKHNLLSSSNGKGRDVFFGGVTECPADPSALFSSCTTTVDGGVQAGSATCTFSSGLSPDIPVPLFVGSSTASPDSCGAIDRMCPTLAAGVAAAVPEPDPDVPIVGTVNAQLYVHSGAQLGSTGNRKFDGADVTVTGVVCCGDAILKVAQGNLFVVTQSKKETKTTLTIQQITFEVATTVSPHFFAVEGGTLALEKCDYVSAKAGDPLSTHLVSIKTGTLSFTGKEDTDKRHTIDSSVAPIVIDPLTADPTDQPQVTVTYYTLTTGDAFVEYKPTTVTTATLDFTLTNVACQSGSVVKMEVVGTTTVTGSASYCQVKQGAISCTLKKASGAAPEASGGVVDFSDIEFTNCGAYDYQMIDDKRTNVALGGALHIHVAGKNVKVVLGINTFPYDNAAQYGKNLYVTYNHDNLEDVVGAFLYQDAFNIPDSRPLYAAKFLYPLNQSDTSITVALLHLIRSPIPEAGIRTRIFKEGGYEYKRCGWKDIPCSSLDYLKGLNNHGAQELAASIGTDYVFNVTGTVEDGRYLTITADTPKEQGEKDSGQLEVGQDGQFVAKYDLAMKELSWRFAEGMQTRTVPLFTVGAGATLSLSSLVFETEPVVYNEDWTDNHTVYQTTVPLFAFTDDWHALSIASSSFSYITCTDRRPSLIETTINNNQSISISGTSSFYNCTAAQGAKAGVISVAVNGTLGESIQRGEFYVTARDYEKGFTFKNCYTGLSTAQPQRQDALYIDIQSAYAMVYFYNVKFEYYDYEPSFQTTFINIRCPYEHRNALIEDNWGDPEFDSSDSLSPAVSDDSEDKRYYVVEFENVNHHTYTPILYHLLKTPYAASTSDHSYFLFIDETGVDWDGCGWFDLPCRTLEHVYPRLNSYVDYVNLQTDDVLPCPLDKDASITGFYSRHRPTLTLLPHRMELSNTMDLSGLALKVPSNFNATDTLFVVESSSFEIYSCSLDLGPASGLPTLINITGNGKVTLQYFTIPQGYSHPLITLDPDSSSQHMGVSLSNIYNAPCSLVTFNNTIHSVKPLNLHLTLDTVTLSSSATTPAISFAGVNRPLILSEYYYPDDVYFPTSSFSDVAAPGSTFGGALGITFLHGGSLEVEDDVSFSNCSCAPAGYGGALFVDVTAFGNRGIPFLTMDDTQPHFGTDDKANHALVGPDLCVRCISVAEQLRAYDFNLKLHRQKEREGKLMAAVVGSDDTITETVDLYQFFFDAPQSVTVGGNGAEDSLGCGVEGQVPCKTLEYGMERVKANAQGVIMLPASYAPTDSFTLEKVKLTKVEGQTENTQMLIHLLGTSSSPFIQTNYHVELNHIDFILPLDGKGSKFSSYISPQQGSLLVISNCAFKPASDDQPDECVGVRTHALLNYHLISIATDCTVHLMDVTVQNLQQDDKNYPLYITPYSAKVELTQCTFKECYKQVEDKPGKLTRSQPVYLSSSSGTVTINGNSTFDGAFPPLPPETEGRANQEEEEEDPLEGVCEWSTTTGLVKCQSTTLTIDGATFANATEGALYLKYYSATLKQVTFYNNTPVGLHSDFSSVRHNIYSDRCSITVSLEHYVGSENLNDKSLWIYRNTVNPSQVTDSDNTKITNPLFTPSITGETHAALESTGYYKYTFTGTNLLPNPKWRYRLMFQDRSDIQGYSTRYVSPVPYNPVESDPSNQTTLVLYFDSSAQPRGQETSELLFMEGNDIKSRVLIHQGAADAQPPPCAECDEDMCNELSLGHNKKGLTAAAIVLGVLFALVAIALVVLIILLVRKKLSGSSEDGKTQEMKEDSRA